VLPDRVDPEHGMLLAGSPGEYMAGQMGWPDIHCLASHQGGLVAAFEFGMSFSLPLKPEMER
jgi:hypothetical protein